MELKSYTCTVSPHLTSSSDKANFKRPALFRRALLNSKVSCDSLKQKKLFSEKENHQNYRPTFNCRFLSSSSI